MPEARLILDINLTDRIILDEYTPPGVLDDRS